MSQKALASAVVEPSKASSRHSASLIELSDGEIGQRARLRSDNDPTVKVALSATELRLCMWIIRENIARVAGGQEVHRKRMTADQSLPWQSAISNQRARIPRCSLFHGTAGARFIGELGSPTYIWCCHAHAARSSNTVSSVSRSRFRRPRLAAVHRLRSRRGCWCRR